MGGLTEKINSKWCQSYFCIHFIYMHATYRDLLKSCLKCCSGTKAASRAVGLTCYYLAGHTTKIVIPKILRTVQHITLECKPNKMIVLICIIYDTIWGFSASSFFLLPVIATCAVANITTAIHCVRFCVQILIMLSTHNEYKLLTEFLAHTPTNKPQA